MLIVKDEKENVVFKFSPGQLKRSAALQEQVYEMRHKQKHSIYCDCNPQDMAELTIARRMSDRDDENDTIYPVNFNNNGEKHRKDCSLHAKYHGTSDLEQGWTKRETSEGIQHVVNASPSMFKKKDHLLEIPKPLKKPRFYIPSGKNVSSSTVALRGLVSRLNLMAKEDFPNSRLHPNRNPANLKEFLNQMYGTSRKLHLKGRKLLHDYWFNFDTLKDAKNGDLSFVCLPLQDVAYFVNAYGEVNPNKLNVFLDILYTDKATGKDKTTTFKFKCDAAVWETGFYKDKKPKAKSGNTYQTLVGGFVKKTAYGFDFQSIVFLPITSTGLWYESKHEKRVYDLLTQQGIVFYKGYEPIEGYGNFVPDIIFREPLHPEKEYIGEIFGVERNEDYEKTKKRKLELAKDNVHFDFWYWDVTKTRDIPPFYP